MSASICHSYSFPREDSRIEGDCLKWERKGTRYEQQIKEKEAEEDEKEEEKTKKDGEIDSVRA